MTVFIVTETFGGIDGWGRTCTDFPSKFRIVRPQVVFIVEEKPVEEITGAFRCSWCEKDKKLTDMSKQDNICQECVDWQAVKNCLGSSDKRLGDFTEPR